LLLPEVTPKMASQLLKKAEEQLKYFQDRGLKLNEIENLVLAANNAIRERKREQTFQAINKLGELLKEIEKHSSEYLEHIGKCNKWIELAQNLKIEINDSIDLKSSAENDYISENFEAAISKAKDCKQQLNDSLFLFITDEIKLLYNQIKELPSQVIQSKNFQKMFDDADTAIKENDFNLAWIITKQLREDSNKLFAPYLKKIQEVAKDKIIEFQNDIEDAKKQGADLEDAKEVFAELIDRMKKAQLISEFKEIIDYTAAGNSALARALRRKERMESQSKDIKVQLDKTLADFDDLKEYCAIPSSVKELVKSAQNNFSNNKFDAVKENLDICNVKLDKLRIASEPKIELHIQTESLRADLWNRTKITISNKGLACASNIELKFTGPIQIRRMPILENLDYNQTRTFEVGMKPEGAGSVPIDVDIDFKRPWDNKEYHDRQELWLDVLPAHSGAPGVGVPPGQATTFRKSTTETNCIFCHSEIKKSEPIFKCNCGTIYHLGCITDLERCINCESPIKHQVSVTPPGKIPSHSTDDVDWD
jgi:hypothetical protein